MSLKETIRPDVLAVLRREYLATVEYQFRRNNVTVTMTFEQYATLWSPARLRAIAIRLDKGHKELERYLNDRFNRPVCGWRKREDFNIGGTMSVEVARIMRAEDSRRMFQFHRGDTHSELSRQKIGDAKRGKKQPPEQIAKRTASRVATMARKRAEKAALVEKGQ